MQPLQCDLQPDDLQEPHKATRTGTTILCKTPRRNESGPERPQPHLLHTGGCFHRCLQALYTKKHKVSCPGPLPKTYIEHVKFMRPLQCDLQTQLQETHRTPTSPPPFLTTPFITSPLPFPPHPFLTTSLLHNFPPSPLPFVTTPVHNQFPSSPLPVFTTSLHHHSPSSSLPFFTTALRHHSTSPSVS